MVRTAVVAVAFGAVALLGAIALDYNTRRIHHHDLRDIARMRANLDSLRSALARAATGPDSARLIEAVGAREEGIAVREFHVPLRQAQLDGWWQPTGPGTLAAAAGAILVLGGLAALRRRQGAT